VRKKLYRPRHQDRLRRPGQVEQPFGQRRYRFPYHAIGIIDYRSADGAECTNGHVLYIKPAYHGTEGAGIVSYATAHDTFPHEDTADQWFSESQFESYRSLGVEITNTILDHDVSMPDDRKPLHHIFADLK
jgi:hypothetical protein